MMIRNRINAIPEIIGFATDICQCISANYVTYCTSAVLCVIRCMPFSDCRRVSLRIPVIIFARVAYHSAIISLPEDCRHLLCYQQVTSGVVTFVSIRTSCVSVKQNILLSHYCLQYFIGEYLGMTWQQIGCEIGQLSFYCHHLLLCLISSYGDDEVIIVSLDQFIFLLSIFSQFCFLCVGFFMLAYWRNSQLVL